MGLQAHARAQPVQRGAGHLLSQHHPVTFIFSPGLLKSDFQQAGPALAGSPFLFWAYLSS